MSSDTNVFIATVLSCVPELGLAVVTKNRHNPQISNLIIAYLPYNDGPYGVSQAQQIPVGSSVMCASYDTRPVAYILGPANDTPGDTAAYGGELFYHVGKVADTLCSTDLDAEHKFLDTVLVDLTEFVRTSRGTADGDSLPGDYNAADVAGLVGFHIGRLLSVLRGSPLAYVDVSAITHKVRMVGKMLEFHTLAGETAISETLHVVNTALSAREALGLLNDETAESADDLPEAFPFYRMQQLRGKSPAGSEEALLTPPEGTALHIEEPATLHKHRVGISGEEQTFSAHSLGTIKTPDIRSILQTNYIIGDGGPELRIPYEEEDTEDTVSESPDAEIAVDDAALHQKERYEADYTGMMKLGLAADGLMIGEKSMTGRFKDKSTSLGPTKETSYPLPPELKIVDPATGREHVYYLSTSFIRQLEDGSIIIGDGYGSEIRMSRGNIYIASALDTFIRPGRDAVQMVPRNLVLNAQTRGIFNTKGSLYLRAVNDLQIGATGDRGHLTIECRSDDGLSIRSNAGLSITCSTDMYIGRNDHAANTRGAVTEARLPGSIIIDAGDLGMISQQCGECSVDATNIYLKAHDSDSTGSLFLLTPTQGIAGMSALQLTGHLKMQRYSEPLSIPCRNGQNTVYMSVSQQDTCNLLVSGNGRFGKSIKADGSLAVVNSLVANSIGTVGGIGKIEKEDRPKADFPSPSKVAGGLDNLGEDVENRLNNASTSTYQDAFIMDNAFCFPNSDEYGVPSDLRMPAMLWQINTDSNATWKELPVEDEVEKGEVSYCYPGELWETANIGDAEYGSVPLKDNYRTNV